MEPSVLIAFVGVAAALIVVPGPDWALVTAAALRDGAVAPAVGGLAIGYTLVTVVVALGLGSLAATAPAALVALTLGGAAYLVWAGLSILRAPVTAAPVHAEVGMVRTGHFVRQGVGVSALNPKSLLFFLAFLPQFARPSGPWPLTLQLAVLGGLWIVLTAVFYTFLGQSLRHTLSKRPRWARAITRLAGAAMLLAGIGLVAEQVTNLAIA